MTKTCVAVVDIGSSNINVMIGTRGVNNTFVVLGNGDYEYAGYYEGEFLEEEKLQEVFKCAIFDAEETACESIDKLFVGVPADFSVCETKTLTQSYGEKVKITKQHIEQIHSMANSMQNSSDYVLVSCSPISYILDDGRKTLSPIGQKSTKIIATLSLVYAEKKFIEKINNLLRNIGISTVEYLSGPLCEATYLLPAERREEVALVIDCGYITTSVALVQGDGLVALRTFAVGGAHIVADLSECLGISYREAQNLKKQIILSVKPTEADEYEILRKDNVLKIQMLQANEIVCARLDYIASLINKCLEGLRQEYPKMPYSITGGGISYIKGAKDYISKMLGVNVTLIAPNDIHMQKPHYSSILGLLNTALNQDIKLSFVEKLLQKIKRKK